MPKKDKRRRSKSRVELRINCDIAKILKVLVPGLLALIVLMSGHGYPRPSSTPLQASATSMPPCATTGQSIAVMRSVYSHPLPKEQDGGTDAIAAALQKDS